MNDSLTFGFPLPYYRYVLWDDLPGPIRKIARDYDLDYNENMWNLEKENPIEEKAFASLNSKQKQAATEIYIYEESWDCWLNHYEGYDWRELEIWRYDEPYKVLGFNEEVWEGESDEMPDTEYMWWSELSDEQRQAAATICYFESLWNVLDMTNETFKVPEMVTGTYYPTMSPTS